MSIKLSDTQDAAIREVAELGYTAAKANTIKSLEGKGLIEQTGATHHKLTDAGREYLGLPAVEELEESLGAEIPAEDRTHEELKSLLQGDPWKMDEPLADWELELLSGTVQADTFDNSLPDAIKVNMGFTATLDWRNTKVWDGLTAEQIREDLDTRVPANRADKRAYAKAHRKAVKQLVGAL